MHLVPRPARSPETLANLATLFTQAKPSKKKTYEDKDVASRVEDEPLDDPVAEKLRRQRYAE